MHLQPLAGGESDGVGSEQRLEAVAYNIVCVCVYSYVCIYIL